MPASIPRTKLILAMALSWSLCSCAAYGAQVREAEISNYSGAEIWRQITEFAESRGFRADPEVTDLGRRTFQSRWVGQSVSFRRGIRKRFYAQIVRREDKVADWIVQFYVEIQGVSDSSKNMRPEDDDWEFTGQDGVKETEFRRVLEFALPKKGRETDNAEGDSTGARR